MTDIPVLVPEGKKYTDLTMGELDVASYHLKADVLECIAGIEKAKRYGALIEVAVLWAKRSGATETRDVLIKRFRDYEPIEIFTALRKDDDQAEAPDPTNSTDELNGSSSLESSADSHTS